MRSKARPTRRLQVDPWNQSTTSRLVVDYDYNKLANQRIDIHFSHVKGQSDDRGNDKADERVQWGKGEAPFCHLNVNGAREDGYLERPMTSPSRSRAGTSANTVACASSEAMCDDMS